MPSACVYVGQLNAEVEKKDLEREFRKFGSVRRIWIAKNPPWLAFINFEDDKDAIKAIEKMNGAVIKGSKICCDISRSRGSRGRSSGRPARRDPFSQQRERLSGFSGSIHSQSGAEDKGDLRGKYKEGGPSTVSKEYSSRSTLIKSMYEKVELESRRNRDFDLLKFLKSEEPETPQELTLKMGEFDLNKIRSLILINISRQDIKLNSDTTDELIQFLGSECQELTQQIYLQLLLHFSKLDVNFIEKNYDEDSSNYFNRELSAFLKHAARKPHKKNIVSKVKIPLEKKIKRYLLNQPIIKSIMQSLNFVEAIFNEEDCKTAIMKMEVFTCQEFSPLPELRGCCLLTGILYCSTNLARPKNSFCYDADLVTLAAHASSHYLARVSANNMNYSTPYAKSFFSEAKICDPVIKDLPLEIGRLTELSLFDGIQVAWDDIPETTARLFLKRLEQSSIPVMKKSEFKQLRIFARKDPSVGFGIDVIEYDVFE